MSQVTRKFLDNEKWLYEERTTDFLGSGGYSLRITHQGEHRFVKGRCPCGVLELGIVE